MKKIKQWFYQRFLPMWAKETLLHELNNLRAENEKLLFQLAEKESYIEGLRAGIKAQRRIVINAVEGKK